eukprot:228681_1
MQPFLILSETNCTNTPKSADEFINEYGDDSKDQYFDDTLTMIETSEFEPVHQQKQIIIPEHNQQQEEEVTVVIECDSDSDMEKEAEDDDHDLSTSSESEEEEEEEEDELDDTVYLDQDIKLKQLLNKKGYKKVVKLVTTDQGSVWRAKAGKKYGNSNVVIKVASKAYYEFDECEDDEKGTKKIYESEHENILKEIEILRRLNIEQENASNEDVRNSIIRVIDTIDDNKTNNYMVILEDGGKDLFHFTKNCHQEIAIGKITNKEWKKK